ncbi:MAG TPA: hypothetical protein VNT42_03290 [Sphingomonas sp.]|nr:hypothetical protein [Sphingomonas sp.]
MTAPGSSPDAEDGSVTNSLNMLQLFANLVDFVDDLRVRCAYGWTQQATYYRGGTLGERLADALTGVTVLMLVVIAIAMWAFW